MAHRETGYMTLFITVLETKHCLTLLHHLKREIKYICMLGLMLFLTMGIAKRSSFFEKGLT
jgi:hypothetical protein